ncbi:hypothetical protein RY279_19625, partial [Bacillus velezensis]|uniref:hypothetical protein n=1 Tax=Bacillus velezensis TaxID=492670 RepID=UPI003A89F75C
LFDFNRITHSCPHRKTPPSLISDNNDPFSNLKVFLFVSSYGVSPFRRAFFFMCHKTLGFDIACLKQKITERGNAFSLQKQPEQIALFAYKDAVPFFAVFLLSIF